jgi:hypothetical protein
MRAKHCEHYQGVCLDYLVCPREEDRQKAARAEWERRYAKRAGLVAKYKTLSRQLNEFISDVEYEAIRKNRDAVQTEIEAIDGSCT